MNMNIDMTLAFDWLTYQDIASMWPLQPPPPRARILNWSRNGLFPPYFRPGDNKKAEPLFDRQKVELWLEDAFRPLFAKAKADRRATKPKGRA